MAEVEFCPEKFSSDPDEDIFWNLTKEQLVTLASYLKVQFKKSMRKAVIQGIIAEYFVSQELFDESAVASLKPVSDLGIKKLELESQEKERERLHELEKLKMQQELEQETQEKDRLYELEKLKMQQEIEKERLEIEKLRIEHSTNQSVSAQNFDVSKNIRLVPPFQEKDLDKYFLHFEKVAQNLKWPKQNWTLLLQTVLVGKARDVFTTLSVEQSQDYEHVKSVLLKAYELVPEAYRQKFRAYFRDQKQTYVEFSRQKELLFNRWVESTKIEKNYDKLHQLILLEEFKNCVPAEIRVFIDERKPATLHAAALIADEYALTHKPHFVNKSRSNGNPRSTVTPCVNQSNKNHDKTSTQENQTVIKNSNAGSNSPITTQGFPKPPVCKYCKKEGHLISECFKLKKKEQEKQVNGFLKSSHDTLGQNVKTDRYADNVSKTHDVEPVIGCQEKAHCSVMDVFEPFIHDGFVSLPSDSSSPIPIRILRDTGASQSLILTSVLPFCDDTFSGSHVLIQGINSIEFSSIPLHNIRLKSDLVSGCVTLGVTESLPFDGIHLLLGNDLAGSKVIVDPVVCETPCFDQEIDPVEHKIPQLYPACAVTRSMAKKSPDVDLSDTFLSQVFDMDSRDDISTSRQRDVDLSDTFHGDVSEKSSNNVSVSGLVEAQHMDPQVSTLFPLVVDSDEISETPVCYFFKNNILMRKWRPPDLPADDDYAVAYQIVVPEPYRAEILSIAHETPLSGHLGIRKTTQKILKHFYWPGIWKDVSKFCRSCHTCQMVGKPNQTIPKAQLQPIPAFEQPFSHVLVDCVGPLPKTKSGNQYLLTIMCASTRFPEAVPLRNIKAKTIVKALVKFFTMVGLPKSIQSDQGSNFMSGLFQEVMHELDITQFRSSAYHPESQGALERFHQTLKNMIRTYCFGSEKDWDEGIHLLLFAARESVQESLGFSPFELVFGHQVRGPLKLLKEKFISDNHADSNLLQYVSDFRDRLHNISEIAKQNLEQAQTKMKAKYDVKAVERTFEPGQKVLAFLPVSNNPLHARYFGPYVIDKKLNNLNYVLLTPDRRKKKQLCHVNMIKPYIDRNHPSVVSSVACSTVQVSCDPSSNKEDDSVQSEQVHREDIKLQNSDILMNIDDKLSHLTYSQSESLREVIQEFRDLFPNVPSRTDKISHDVIIEEGSIPLKQPPYRLNPTKTQYLREEVKYLLENDLIEPSNSNWSSPCILIPKQDGSYRMCTDYRKVNNITKSDTFPIPRIDDCIDKIGSATFVSKFDLLKGFWQVPLTDQAKEISAFTTPFGLFQYKVMPFGMKNSPATFQRLVNSVLSGLDNCEAYIDDVIVYNNNWEDHVETIRKLFFRLRDAKLTVNLAKCDFGCGSVTYLGHTVGKGQVRPIDAKIKVISDFPQPETKKQLMRFLGMAGFYRKFCPNFSSVSSPLTRLLCKKIEFIWTDECQKAFDKLKAILKSAPVLTAPNFQLPFKIAVDASDVGAGSVLLQEGPDSVDHPVGYFSKKFNKSQKNYSTVEKECLSLVLALQHFEIYVTASNTPVVIFTDHNPLTFLSKMKNKNQRLLRWSLALQEYNLDIRHIRGKDNVIADCLSRI